MSVLRAWSDAVIVGRGTMNAEPPGATWHWQTVAPPDMRPRLAEFAASLRRPGPHWNVFVSASGEGLDLARRPFHDPDVHAVIVTTAAGSGRLRPRLAAAAGAQAEVWEIEASADGVDVADLLGRLLQAGRRHVLLECGPMLYGAFESRGLVDELFLTHRALVAGTSPERPRAGFSGHVYPGEALPRLELVSVRAAPEEPVLFTRWRYARAG
jgi:riboflavin biosynthesis pyrimidine reductase